jgi:ADP-heptose:LPS heptosyltransferase
MRQSQIKFDCIFFKGDVPCEPNKLRGKICDTCDEYSQIKKRILIIKLGAIGDVIRTTPLLVKYRSLFPGCHLSWLTSYPEILPAEYLDKTYMFNFNSVYRLKNMDFDIAVNLDKEQETCMLLNEINSKEKFGFTWSDNHISAINKAAEDKLLTGIFDKLSKENKKSFLEEIFEICGMKFNNEPYILETEPVYSEKWNSLREKSSAKRIIGLNTGCGKRWQTRLWPKEYWVDLIIRLKENNFFPVLLGGPDEHSGNIKYSKQTGAYYPGTFSLSEFIAIVSKCDIIVTAVSMTMHIAIALKKPLVLMNNIFNKYEFELYGNGEIVEPDSGCDCYYGSYCKRDKSCMFDLTPKKLFDAVLRNIKEQV